MPQPAPEHRRPPADYERYKGRKIWKTIKTRIFERDSKTCVRCGGEASVVHHRSYAPEVMAGEADEWLVSLCNGCHAFIHFIIRPDGEYWRTWEETERLLATPAATDFPEPKVRLNEAWPALPDGWKQMSAVQRSGWWQRRIEMRVTRRAARDFGSRAKVEFFATNEEALAAANAFLDGRQELVGRFRDTRAHMTLAMLSQGGEAPENATWMTTGIPAHKAKARFEESVSVLVRRDDVTAEEAAELEVLGIWHLPQPTRRKRAKVLAAAFDPDCGDLG